MPRVGAALTAVLLGVAVGLCIVTSSDVGVAVASTGSGKASTSVVLDRQFLVMETLPGSDGPNILAPRAIALAASHLPATIPSTIIQARFVSLTLRDADGGIVRDVRSRSSWLVTYEGVAYAPSGSSASVCACDAPYYRPSTVAAVDAETGELIAIMGVGK